VIVRIQGEGQYELPPDAARRLHAIDEALLRHLEAGDASAFQEDFLAALALVREEGRPLPEEVLQPSAFVLPREVPTLEEARQFFHEEA
jgi:hypothetical protein